MVIETKKCGPSSPSSRVGVEVSRHELKFHDPEVFDTIVARIREALDQHDAEVRGRQKTRTA